MGLPPQGCGEGEGWPRFVSGHILVSSPQNKTSASATSHSLSPHPLPVPSFLTCSPHSAFPSLCSGPLGPVIIRKEGRRGAILAHQGFRGSWACVLETWGCKAFCVFLLFQPRYLPTRAGPVLKSRRLQGQEHMALHVDMCLEKCECVCVSMCEDVL